MMSEEMLKHLNEVEKLMFANAVECINTRLADTLRQLAAARAENEGLRADAERYRWLGKNIVFCAFYTPSGLEVFKSPHSLSAAIDAARASDPATTDAKGEET